MVSSEGKRAVALLSGGLDSTVSMAAWLHDNPGSAVVRALTFDYGQRPLQQELWSASQIAAYYEVAHQVIRLPWLGALLPPGLAAADSKGGQSHGEGPLPVQSVWVPNRNGVLLNIAASVAESLGATVVLFGSNLEEAEAGFPDNTVAYRAQVSKALAYSTLNHVEVVAPVETLDKAAIVARGVSLEIPFHLLWSCYEAGDEHCGQCASCQLLKAAAQRHGVRIPFKG
jgi:7-cyano-7-deazaguanine synthase